MFKVSWFYALFHVESGGNGISFTVHRSEEMFSGNRLQGYFMKILRLGEVGFVKMPKDSGIGIAMSQFYCDNSSAAVQQFGQNNMGIHGRIDKLHDL